MNNKSMNDNESMNQDVYMNQNESKNDNESMNDSDNGCQQQNNSLPSDYNHSAHKRRRQSNNSNQPNKNNSNNNTQKKRSRLHSPVVDHFLQAAENGDYATVVRMLVHKEIVGNETNRRRESALYLAVQKMGRCDVTPDVVMNLFSVMNILLEYQPTLLNQQNEAGLTPLFLATLSRNLQPARFLLERGADERVTRWGGFVGTPLQWLIRVGHYPPALLSLFQRARSIRNIAKLKRGLPRLRDAMRRRPHKRLAVKLALDAASSTFIPEVLIDIMMEYVPLVESTEK